MRTLTLLALILLASTGYAKPEPDAIKSDWNALIASNCDLSAHAVRTPFAASVLRNTPYALAGYAFKSDGLRAIFAADGDWYVPKGKATPKFSPKVSACIARIKAFEATIKPAKGTWKAFKERVFKSRMTYLEIRGHSQLMQGAAATLSATDTAMDVKCAGCTGLQYFQIMCDDNDCLVIVPGTGDLP
jgi:hypothetical protein